MQGSKKMFFFSFLSTSTIEKLLFCISMKRIKRSVTKKFENEKEKNHYWKHFEEVLHCQDSDARKEKNCSSGNSFFHHECELFVWEIVKKTPAVPKKLEFQKVDE